MIKGSKEVFTSLYGCKYLFKFILLRRCEGRLNSSYDKSRTNVRNLKLWVQITTELIPQIEKNVIIENLWVKNLTEFIVLKPTEPTTGSWLFLSNII